MKNYEVELDYFVQKSKTFKVEAENEDQAETQALGVMNRDFPEALDPFVLTVKEIKNVE